MIHTGLPKVRINLLPSTAEPDKTCCKDAHGVKTARHIDTQNSTEALISPSFPPSLSTPGCVSPITRNLVWSRHEIAKIWYHFYVLILIPEPCWFYLHTRHLQLKHLGALTCLLSLRFALDCSCMCPHRKSHPGYVCLLPWYHSLEQLGGNLETVALYTQVLISSDSVTTRGPYKVMLLHSVFHLAWLLQTCQWKAE